MPTATPKRKGRKTAARSARPAKKSALKKRLPVAKKSKPVIFSKEHRMTSDRYPLVCFYFQVHQPYRLKDLRITDIGRIDSSFDDVSNKKIFRKVAEKCYLPTNALILELVKKYPNFRVSYSLSGVFMDQCEAFGPDVLESFKKLAATGQVEFIAETHYHSLSALKSLPEFCAQVRKQVNTIERLFGQTPTIFRNTELIYRNELAEIVRNLGFRGMIAEGVDRLLGTESANEPRRPPSFTLPAEVQTLLKKERIHKDLAPAFQVLLKNYRLSDDIAFRFSNKSWEGHPLTVEKFTDWLLSSGGHCVNLFMDYETFGEHQWADSGIFEFLKHLPGYWEKLGVTCATPSQVLDIWGNRHARVYDAHEYISWADSERDLSAWLGNQIQNAALDQIYSLEADIKALEREDLLSDWRKLQTSDHFYYMCTKFWSDGDVHKYFSPYDSPYEAYRRFSHALHDLKVRIQMAGTQALVRTKKSRLTTQKKPVKRRR